MGYNIYQKFALAKSLVTELEVLTELANDEIANVRAFVARNPNISNNTLARLIKDNVSFVQQSCAENPKLNDLDLVKLLAQDPISRRKIALYNQNSATLEHLFTNFDDFPTKNSVLLNPLCPTKLFINLKNKQLLQTIAEDCNTPSWILLEIQSQFPQAQNHPNFKNVMGALLDKITFLESS
jgi:hypothetical protein